MSLQCKDCNSQCVIHLDLTRAPTAPPLPKPPTATPLPEHAPAPPLPNPPPAPLMLGPDMKVLLGRTLWYILWRAQKTSTNSKSKQTGSGISKGIFSYAEILTGGGGPLGNTICFNELNDVPLCTYTIFILNGWVKLR